MSSFGLQDVSRLQLVSKKVTFSYFLSEKYFDWEEKITETNFFPAGFFTVMQLKLLKARLLTDLYWSSCE